MRLHALLLIIAAFWSGIAQAATSCDAILVHGLRNIEVSSSRNEATSLKFQQNCGKDFASSSDEVVANAEVEVFGYGGGSAGFSRKQREDRLKQWCDTNRQVATSSGAASTSSQTFYQGAVSAWDNCNKLYSQNLRIEPIISPDAKTVTIGIAYTGPTTDGVKLYAIRPEGFSCSITTPETGQKVAFPIVIKTENIQALCKRTASINKVRDGTTYEVIPRGTISVQTASYPFQMFFAEEWDPGVPFREAEQIRQAMTKMDLPVGTVITSSLPPPVFLNGANPQFDGSRWVEANGSNLPPNSKYERMSGSKVSPNLAPLQEASMILDVVSSALVASNTNVSALQTTKGKGGSWTWYASLGDIAGQRVNNDYEQDSDNFRVTIDPAGAISAAGRTLNWKQIGWAGWNNGSANLLGISTYKNPLFYYVKVN